MLNYGSINIRRIIMHTIHPKPAKVPDARAYADYSEKLFVVEESVQAILRARLNEAAGKVGKSFKLEISEFESGSFYEACDLLKLKSDDEFISISKKIADKLAGAQKKTNTPGGFLLVIEASFSTTGASAYIVIKAEPHDALVFRQSNIEKLSDIFLSPTQKLYKIGVLVERGPNGTPNQRYDAHLFDDQFNSSGLPAEYFYKDFLGLSIDTNAELTSALFHRIVDDYVKTNEEMSPDQKFAALDGLRTEFQSSASPFVEPLQFGRTYIPDPKVRDGFEKAINELPRRFKKDSALIKSKVNNKKIDFPDKIKISGPDAQFDKRVKILNNPDDLDDLIAGDSRYTIVLISGRPFDQK